MWLITGGSGFIGTNFALYLIEKGHPFKIYDVKKSKYLPENVETVIGDIRDKEKLAKAMKGCDVVFHLASVVPSVKLADEEIYDIDVNGTKNVLEAAEKNGVKRVIFTSSASHVYGLVPPGSCPLKEDAPLNPINEYGRNKVLTEELIREFSERTSIECISLRLSMVLGPYNFDPIMKENVKTVIENKTFIMPGDGSSKSHSIHVDDVNEAILLCAKKELPERCVTLNIAGEEVLTLDQTVDLLKRITGSCSRIIHIPAFLAKAAVSLGWSAGRSSIHPSYIPMIAQDLFFDINKAEELLGWKPKVSVENSLKDSVDFLKNERE